MRDQLYPTLCNPMNCSPQSSSVHEIFQARILEWLPSSTPGDLLEPGIEPEPLASPGNGRQIFNHCAIWEFPIEIKCKINVMSLTRPKKTVFHETSPWCLKGWEPLT